MTSLHIICSTMSPSLPASQNNNQAKNFRCFSFKCRPGHSFLSLEPICPKCHSYAFLYAICPHCRKELRVTVKTDDKDTIVESIIKHHDCAAKNGANIRGEEEFFHAIQDSADASATRQIGGKTSKNSANKKPLRLQRENQPEKLEGNSNQNRVGKPQASCSRHSSASSTAAAKSRKTSTKQRSKISNDPLQRRNALATKRIGSRQVLKMVTPRTTGGLNSQSSSSASSRGSSSHSSTKGTIRSKGNVLRNNKFPNNRAIQGRKVKPKLSHMTPNGKSIQNLWNQEDAAAVAGKKQPLGLKRKKKLLTPLDRKPR